MRRFWISIPLLILTGCTGLNTGSEPQINVYAFLNNNEISKINSITFEVQKVLDTIDNFRNIKALDYVQKINVPGWKIYRKTEHIAFIKIKKFIAEKTFKLPGSCIKNIGEAEVNVCHLKLTETLKKMGEAYKCEIKTYPILYPSLAEKIKISCSY